MPRKNVIKQYAENQFYHIYNRGVNKEAIYIDDEDYRVFLNLLKRLLGHEVQKNIFGREYPNYFNEIELNTFCLMPNHFHILIYQHTESAVIKFMQSLAVSYSMYFNKKYDRVGPVFQSQYKASMITNNSYLYHISRYIHLNPTNFREWKYSSLPYYVSGRNATWIKPLRIMQLFRGIEEYNEFLDDYFGYKMSLELIEGSYPSTG